MSDAPILVVEDDADVRSAEVELLEAEGYDVVEAPNGLVAWQLLGRGLHPCLVLLDLMMPVMDGNELLERIRGEDRLAALPVVVLSAARRPDLTGATAYLHKPFDFDAVLGLVARFCGPPPAHG